MKFFSKDVRIQQALWAFIFVTLYDGVVAVIGGIIARWWYRNNSDKNPLLLLPTRWFKKIKQQCFDTVGITWKIESQVGLDDYPGLTIIICNHPSSLLTIAPFCIIGEHVSSRVVTTLKSSHLMNPIGLGLWGLECGIFISRLYDLPPFKWSAQLATALKKCSRWWYKRQLHMLGERARRSGKTIALVIFADQRLTEARLTQYREKYGEQLPQILTWSEVLLPKSGGLLAVLQATRGLPVRVIDMTIASSAVRATGWLDFDQLIASQVFAKIEDVTADLVKTNGSEDFSQIPEITLQGWLVTLWNKKDQRIQNWRHTATH